MRPCDRSVGAEVSELYCDQCGRLAEEPAHERCGVARQLEPPRYCADCGRRMVVQVTPLDWTARCSRHGTRRSHP
jgi:hypothetical protein